MEREKKSLEIDGTHVFETEQGITITDIPSDTNPELKMNIAFALGDVFMDMKGWPDENRDWKSFILIPHMRFRAYAGGGFGMDFPYYLSGLPRAFTKNGGQRIMKNDPPSLKPHGYSEVTGAEIGISEDPDKPWIEIVGIVDDDDSEEVKFMDMSVAQDGNVKITMRNLYFNKENKIFYKILTKIHKAS